MVMSISKRIWLFKDALKLQLNWEDSMS